ELTIRVMRLAPFPQLATVDGHRVIRGPKGHEPIRLALVLQENVKDELLVVAQRSAEDQVGFEVAVITLDVGGRIELEAVEVDGVDLLVTSDAEQVADVERPVQEQLQAILRELPREVFRPMRDHDLSLHFLRTVSELRFSAQPSRSLPPLFKSEFP